MKKTNKKSDGVGPTGKKKDKQSNSTKTLYGDVTLPNGCRVSYRRTFYPGDYRVTDYGPQNSVEPASSHLREHKRRGAVSWGYAVDGLQNRLSGDVTRYGLGKFAKRPEILHLMMSVLSLREASAVQAWEVQVAGTSEGRYPTHGGHVYSVVLDAIREADAELLAPLIACINACKHSESPSASQRMHDAVVSAAKVHTRPPMPLEVACQYYGGKDKVPLSWERGPFYKIMRKAGWGWLILSRRTKAPAP